MSTANLVKMANQIASYFANEPDQAQAASSVRNHMQLFWTPAMRQELLAWHRQQQQSELHPLVRQAIDSSGQPT
ncbi:formate dehydrogenase subunit delta [Pseudomonas sp. MSSRFD41]|uniref:formate dehydrogenase subunit delta n=1 Tax=unclassified Pseudomonas TaxID=196821 RepID=UPI00163A9FD0|nr:formate dehydrogenase subunit delta [Pseudomonas sp. MSSRFD41]MBC2654614.1 formate dehydrogenase subunit delta [Pseudomonas sp. MSSRFD41]